MPFCKYKQVRSMKPGSVIVDLAAPGGGNCALTVPDETIEDKESQVTIIGTCNFAEQMPAQASDLLGSNFVAMLETIGGATEWNLDFDDIVIQKSTVIHDKKIVYDPTPPPQPKKAPEPEKKVEEIPQEIVKSNIDIVLEWMDENSETLALALGSRNLTLKVENFKKGENLMLKSSFRSRSLRPRKI